MLFVWKHKMCYKVNMIEQPQEGKSPSELERLYSLSTRLLSNPEACKSARGKVISPEVLIGLSQQLKETGRESVRYNDILDQLPNVILSGEEYGGYSVRSLFETIDVLQKEVGLGA